MQSPYQDVAPDQWVTVTDKLISLHPLKPKEIVDVVLEAWSSIFTSAIGAHGFKIGKDIFPKPQIMGALLHELIPLEIAARYPKKWRGEKAAEDKDVVCVMDENFSIELKTSSHRNQIFGNRSYAQDAHKNKKSKSGYYLAVNFEKFTPESCAPQISLIRFGWLDHADWIGQRAATGQQSRLTTDIYAGKFRTLYAKS
ncbi:MAG: ScaI family restriction endonuclease [Gallionella sp.]|nr:ScaI family restriction endonuclease [Gallionella sp.]